MVHEIIIKIFYIIIFLLLSIKERKIKYCYKIMKKKEEDIMIDLLDQFLIIDMSSLTFLNLH
jgi:hypothetical protein